MSDESEKEKRVSYPAVWRMLAPIVKPLKWYFLLCVLFASVIAGLGVAEPYIYGNIIDSVTSSVSKHLSPQDGFSAITPYLLAWVGVVLGGVILTGFFVWTGWYIGNQVEKRNQTQVFRKMLTLSLSRFHNERSGAFLNRFIAGDEAIWMLNVHLTRNLLQSLMALIFVLAFGFYLDWRLALASLAVVPIDMGIGFWHLHLSLHKQNKLLQKWEETTGVVGDAFANIATVQSSAGEKRLVKRYVDLYAQVLKIQLKLNYAWAMVDAGTSGVNIAGRLIIFVVGAYLVLKGETTLGSLIMFLGFAGALYGTVQGIFNILPDFSRQLNRLRRLAYIFEEIPEVQDRVNAKPAPKLRGEIEFDHISFAYQDGGGEVLRSVNVKIPAGSTFAIIGESGAGKSTLAKMLARFADPTKGAIRFDGVDLRDMTLESLRPQVGFVMQENLLFHDSVLDNIRFAKQGATREEVIESAKRAQAHEFITRLPKGYDTVVGERGVKLSGGQKQRIALARVLLSNPPILVLDEATSALDSKTEHDLQKALREVMKGRTTIVIAHRLSTVMDADRILVMDKGKIVDEGRHEDLIGRDNLYKKFWEIQAGGYV